MDRKFETGKLSYHRIDGEAGETSRGRISSVRRKDGWVREENGDEWAKSYGTSNGERTVSELRRLHAGTGTGSDPKDILVVKNNQAEARIRFARYDAQIRATDKKNQKRWPI